ncbi:MAG TPA: hypothetical protein DDZ51_27340, partial [Planctomycetaceae bacterium]|nr:hypothetical protein [Planctomycetaceae bacterium]
MKKPNHYRSRLLTSTCAFALAIAGGSASAQEIAIAEGNYVVGINQAFNGFADATASITAITGQQDLVRDVTVGFLVNGDVADSSLVVGGPTGNTTSASLTVNLAETSLNSDVTNDEFGTAGGSAIASTQLASPIDVPRAAAETLSADLGIATSQNVNNTAAAVTNASGIAIVAQNDLLTSTAEVANNTQESVGLLNRNTTTLNSAANSTDASTAISTSQNVTTGLPSVNEPGTSLSVITASVARIELSDLNLSTAKLAGNTQQAIAAANVGVNTTTVDANLINSVVAGPGTTTIDPADVSGNPSATATAGNAISSSQILDLLDAASGPIFAAVDGVGTGFVISVGNDASASTVTNENNAAKALAIGNEVDNAMSLSANSILTADEGLRQVGLIAGIQEVLDPEGGIRFTVFPDVAVAPEIDASTVAFLESLGFTETVTGSGIYRAPRFLT